MSDRAARRLLRDRSEPDTQSAPLDPMFSSLLTEGYALYPYTPEATKNPTPTPFGIVYPPAYAAREASTFDHLQIECILLAPDDAEITAEVRYLVSTGTRHQASQRGVELRARTLASLLDGPAELELLDGDLAGVVRLAVLEIGPGTMRVTLRMDNRTVIEGSEAAALDRPAALRRSFLSTHALLRLAADAGGGRFVSPLERDGVMGEAVASCKQINAWPVLATPEDDAVLGASVFLPDHERIAPPSRGDLFDGTEIEEALLLHRHALSYAERAAIAEQDSWVREMFQRAETTTPAVLLALHGSSDPCPLPPPVTASEFLLPLRDPRSTPPLRDLRRRCPRPDASCHRRSGGTARGPVARDHEEV